MGSRKCYMSKLKRQPQKISQISVRCCFFGNEIDNHIIIHSMLVCCHFFSVLPSPPPVDEGKVWQLLIFTKFSLEKTIFDKKKITLRKNFIDLFFMIDRHQTRNRFSSACRGFCGRTREENLKIIERSSKYFLMLSEITTTSSEFVISCDQVVPFMSCRFDLASLTCVQLSRTLNLIFVHQSSHDAPTRN